MASNLFELREEDFLSGQYAHTPTYHVYYHGKRVFLEGNRGVGFKNKLAPIKYVVRSGNDVIVELKTAKPLSRKYCEKWNKNLLKDHYVAG